MLIAFQAICRTVAHAPHRAARLTPWDSRAPSRSSLHLRWLLGETASDGVLIHEPAQVGARAEVNLLSRESSEFLFSMRDKVAQALALRRGQLEREDDALYLPAVRILRPRHRRRA